MEEINKEQKKCRITNIFSFLNISHFGERFKISIKCYSIKKFFAVFGAIVKKKNTEYH